MKKVKESPRSSETTVLDESLPASPNTRAGNLPRHFHVYHVGKLKVPLHRAEIKLGPKGQFVRRLKEILHKGYPSPGKLPPDENTYEPSRRPVALSRMSSIHKGFTTTKDLPVSNMTNSHDHDDED